MLQRGRARAGAEWGVAAWIVTSSHGFNGAAPARARNASWTAYIDGSKSWLQRGRARAGAECTLTNWTPQ